MLLNWSMSFFINCLMTEYLPNQIKLFSNTSNPKLCL